MRVQSHTDERREEPSKEPAKGNILFQFETFSEFERSLELIFSPSAASVILYTAAIRCGTHSCKRAARKAKTTEEILHLISEQKNQENWGKISFLDVDYEKGSGKVVITDSFETVTRRADQPCCHFFRGFLAGLLSELFKRNVTVSEQKCAGKRDERCEFVF